MAGIMEFVIPLNREELLHSTVGQSYTVTDLVTMNELPGRIEECQTKFAEMGSQAITECFDVFYGAIHYFSKISQSTRELYWNMITEALVDSCCVIDSIDKSQQRSTIKMLVYVVCQFIDEFESLLLSQETVTLTKSRKSKKAVTTNDSSNCDMMWKNERERILVLLVQFLEQDLFKFWDPPTPEMLDDISGLIAGSCYKLLENPVTCRDRNIRQYLASLLGIIIKKYHQNLTVSVKMVQLVQNFEHIVVPLTHCIKLMVSEFQLNSFVSDIIREIANIDPEDLNLSTSGTKNYSSFIVELSQALAKDVAPSVEQLLTHLGGESYTMRCGVLSVFGEVVAQVLTDPDISGESRTVRDSLLDKLQEHIHDVNAFVRSKSLQVWYQLCQAKSIPLPRHKAVLDLIIGRLKDKSSHVRKSAMQTLTGFISGNPFAAKLDLEKFKEQLSTEEEKLRAMLPNDNKESEIKDMSDVTGDTDGDDKMDDSQIENESKDEQNEHEVEIAKQMAIVQYHRDAVIFIEAISQCIPLVIQLLGSKLTSDVLASLELLAAACLFDIKGSHKGICKALVLIWSTESNIRDAIINTYIKLYLSTDDDEHSTSPHSSIVKNLLSLVSNANIGELTSLEEMIALLIKRNDLHDETLDDLCNILSGNLSVSTSSANNDKVEAMILISMFAKGEPNMIQSKLPVLLKYGFVPHNFVLARWLCVTVQRASSNRLPSSHHMVTQLTQFLTLSFKDMSSCNWCSMAEQLITAIYKISENPDGILEYVIKELCLIVFGDAEDNEEDITTEVTSWDDVSFVLLSRLLFVLGHTVKEQLIHLEVSIAKELKSRKGNTEAINDQDDANCNIEDESETITGPSNDDEVEIELIRKVCTDEVCGDGLLGALLPLVVAVVTKPRIFSSLQLQSSATLALSKYMLLSSKLCEQYLRLLFTLLETSPVPLIRANIIIALGDLTVRYPNIIEPWTPHLYSRLRDSEYQVRHNTIVVLTHLIMNDMIKVKGQISELAMCLKDPEQKIVDRAKLFFLELSQKGNSLYNILPDIISHLSDPDVNNNLTTTEFQNIMKYLLSFIEKEKHSEGLVEKLCHRFRTTRVEEQNRHIAFCLSQLNFSERSIKKLQENLPCYQGLLSDVELFDLFINIIGKAKKCVKAENKIVLEEFEAKLTEIHKKGLEEEETNETAVLENSILATPSQSVAKTKSKSVRISTVKKTPARKSSHKGVLTSITHNLAGSAISSARRSKLGNDEDGVVYSTRKRQKKRLIAPPISDSDDDD